MEGRDKMVIHVAPAPQNNFNIHEGGKLQVNIKR